ncbi:MAG: hypothetical protein COC24_000720 [Alphaproteobacteria bacterium]|nr:hypothetical protein [Alphaproteobacteria bacterium]
MLLSEQNLKKILQQAKPTTTHNLPEFEVSVMAKIELYNKRNLEAQTERSVHRDKISSGIFLSLTVLFGLIISIDFDKSIQHIELIFIETISIGMMIYCSNSLFRLWKYRPNNRPIP